MTLTATVTFYKVRVLDGVRVKMSEVQVSGTSFADIKAQCDQLASDTGYRYTFEWET